MLEQLSKSPELITALFVLVASIAAGIFSVVKLIVEKERQVSTFRNSARSELEQSVSQISALSKRIKRLAADPEIGFQYSTSTEAQEFDRLYALLIMSLRYLVEEVKASSPEQIALAKELQRLLEERLSAIRDYLEGGDMNPAERAARTLLTPASQASNILWQLILEGERGYRSLQTWFWGAISAFKIAVAAVGVVILLVSIFRIGYLLWSFG